MKLSNKKLINLITDEFSNINVKFDILQNKHICKSKIEKDLSERLETEVKINFIEVTFSFIIYHHYPIHKLII